MQYKRGMEKELFSPSSPSPLDELTSLSLDPPAASPEDEMANADLPAVPLPEPDHLVLICGGGHVAQEVTRLAVHAGFAVDVLDTRPEYATRERFPEARRVEVCSDYALLDQEYPLEARHYAVILTHSYESDLAVLRLCLESPVRYIGVAASERKKEGLFAQLREEDVPDAELASVRCPIGLAIGAESAEELGIAIAAELIAARAGCLPRPRQAKR